MIYSSSESLSDLKKERQKDAAWCSIGNEKHVGLNRILSIINEENMSSKLSKHISGLSKQAELAPMSSDALFP